MGSYAQLTVGDLDIAHFKSEVEPWVALAFTAEERRCRPATADELDHYGQDHPWEITELVAPVHVVRDRLELTGAGWDAAAQDFEDLVRSKREVLRDVLESFPHEDSIRERIGREIEHLARFDLNQWVAALRDSAPDAGHTSRLDLGSRQWLIDLWSDGDIRLCLRAALECRPDEVVTVDITDLIEGGWLAPDDDPRESALLAFGWAERHASPIVVLTEGSIDAQILETALAITYPHLRGCIGFPDFSHQPEANAGALVKTVKAFAAAGITNRVVALFDADSAARDAVQSLALEQLPPSIQVRHLPRIDFACSYPTIGPSGAVVFDDVHGRACSIELYLGVDVLTDPRGQLRPVRWTAFLQGVNEWQGVVDGRREILSRFRAKAEMAIRDPASSEAQDWSGLRAVIDVVRLAFVDRPRYLPSAPRDHEESPRQS